MRIGASRWNPRKWDDRVRMYVQMRAIPVLHSVYLAYNWGVSDDQSNLKHNIFSIILFLNTNFGVIVMENIKAVII